MMMYSVYGGYCAVCVDVRGSERSCVTVGV